MAILVSIYLAPTITAFRRKLRLRWIIFVINICTGWTGVTWVIAFIMAIWPERVKDIAEKDKPE